MSKYSTFGDRLKYVRGLRHLSQTELAYKTKLQPSAISHFESARRMPSGGNVCKLSTALNVCSDYLLGLCDLPTTPNKKSEGLMLGFEELTGKNQAIVLNLVKFLREEQ